MAADLLACTRLLKPFAGLPAEVTQLDSHVVVPILSEPLQSLLELALSALQVGVPEMVKTYGNLNEALEEIACRPADSVPHILESVMTFEKHSSVELIHAKSELSECFRLEIADIRWM